MYVCMCIYIYIYLRVYYNSPTLETQRSRNEGLRTRRLILHAFSTNSQSEQTR
jgi:hypothetical protein